MNFHVTTNDTTYIADMESTLIRCFTGVFGWPWMFVFAILIMQIKTQGLSLHLAWQKKLAAVPLAQTQVYPWILPCSLCGWLALHLQDTGIPLHCCTPHECLSPSNCHCSTYPQPFDLPFAIFKTSTWATWPAFFCQSKIFRSIDKLPCWKRRYLPS